MNTLIDMEPAAGRLMLAGRDEGPRNRSGLVYAANESRFSAGSLSEPLTAYSLGWRDPFGYEELLEWIAPRVPVGRLFEFQKALKSEAYLTETEEDVHRAIGANFKRVDYGGEKARGKTLNKGLTMRVDHDDAILADNGFELVVSALRRRLLRIDLKAALAALSAACGMPLEANWSGDAEPKAELRAAARAAQDETGVRPNKVLFSGAAFDAWQDCYEAKNTAGGFANAARTPDEIARALNLPGGGRVSEEVALTTAATPQAIVAGVFLFYAESGILRDDPSHVKRFTSGTQANTPFAVYVEEHAKYTDVTVEHYNQIVAVDTKGARTLAAG
jgi:hypothetical protein